MAATAVAVRSRAAGVAAVLAVVMTAGGLVIYKATGALKVPAKASSQHALGPKPRWIDVGDAGATRPVLESLNYLAWIAIALLFGVAIAATVRAFVPQRWLERTVAGEG